MAPAEPFVKHAPVEAAGSSGVSWTLATGRNKINLPLTGKLPVEGDCVPPEIPIGEIRVRAGGRAGGCKIEAEIDETFRGNQLGIAEEGCKVAMEPGRVEVPVDDEHGIAVASENPGHVGQGHRPANASFVGVKGQNFTFATHYRRLLVTGLAASRLRADRHRSV